MDRGNFTIDGHLAMPGASRLRVPPPFGSSRDILETIESRRTSALADDLFAALGVGSPHGAPAWRPRLTLLAVGVACTVAAAWLGAYTGQRRDPTRSREPLLATTAPLTAITQPSQPQAAVSSGKGARAMTPSPPAATAANPDLATASSRRPSAAALPSAKLAGLPRNVEVAATTARPFAQSDLPHPLERTVSRNARTAAPAILMHPPIQSDDAPRDGDILDALAETSPISSGYVAPTSPVHIDLQRHTRLTD